MRVLLLVVTCVAIAHAQVPCDDCAAGNRLLDKLGVHGQALRTHARELAEIERLQIEDTAITFTTHKKLMAWRRAVDAAVDDAIEATREIDDRDLLAIGFALCSGNEINCARHLALAFRCANRQCKIEPVRARINGHGCTLREGHRESEPYAFGYELASGWETSASPVDHAAWSAGIEGRFRVTDRVGLVARADRSVGRDEALDANGDGYDDNSTPDVARTTLLAGGSLLLSLPDDPDPIRYWQLDLLGGYAFASPDPDSLAAAADVSFRIGMYRLGLRAVQQLGDATDARTVLLHAGVQTAADPVLFFDEGSCGHEAHPMGSRWAIGLDLPLLGKTLDVGRIVPGFGIEGTYHAHDHVDVVVHGDLLAMPSGHRERSLYQSALVGVRGDSDNLFVTFLGGYSLVAAPSSSPVQSEPIVDVGAGLQLQTPRRAVHVAAHGRAGLGSDAPMRAFFLSVGFELRLEPRRWRDRERVVDDDDDDDDDDEEGDSAQDIE